MRQELRVKLEWEDLVEGERENVGSCAVSHAIKRLYPKYHHVSTNRTVIKMSDPEEGKRYEFATPLVVLSFIKGFDSGAITPDDHVDLAFSLRREEAIAFDMKRDTRDASVRHAQEEARRERLANETPAQRAERERKAARRKAVSRRGRLPV